MPHDREIEIDFEQNARSAPRVFLCPDPADFGAVELGRSGDFRWSWRGFIDDDPKQSKVMNGLRELFKIHGFDHVGIDAALITLHEVLFLTGGSEHHHGNGFEFGVVLDVFQNLEPVDFGHLQIEEDHRGVFG